MVICIDYKEVYKSQGKTPWTRGAQAESCSGPGMKDIKEKSTSCAAISLWYSSNKPLAVSTKIVTDPVNL